MDMADSVNVAVSHWQQHGAPFGLNVRSTGTFKCDYAYKTFLGALISHLGRAGAARRGSH